MSYYHTPPTDDRLVTFDAVLGRNFLPTFGPPLLRFEASFFWAITQSMKSSASHGRTDETYLGLVMQGGQTK